MRRDLRHRRYGTTIDEWTSAIPEELPIDAVGLWQIVPAGRDGFGLSGNELVEFVRACVMALLGKGAKPVIGSRDGDYIWRLANYGETPEQIADAIIAEWQRSGREPDAGGPWFALPHIYQHTRASNELNSMKDRLS
jgi:hypothetical protein